MTTTCEKHNYTSAFGCIYCDPPSVGYGARNVTAPTLAEADRLAREHTDLKLQLKQAERRADQLEKEMVTLANGNRLHQDASSNALIIQNYIDTVQKSVSQTQARLERVQEQCPHAWIDINTGRCTICGMAREDVFRKREQSLDVSKKS